MNFPRKKDYPFLLRFDSGYNFPTKPTICSQYGVGMICILSFDCIKAIVLEQKQIFE